MINLIANNNKPVSREVEIFRESQLNNQSKPSTVSPNTEIHKGQNSVTQWARIESTTMLNTQNKSQLIQLNPTLAKTLIAQIKGEPISHNNPLSPQNITVLKQSSLYLLALKVDNTAIHIVTPNNISESLGKSTLLPIVQTENGWQVATNHQLKVALQTAAGELLKQNLPLQGSTIPLLKIARIISDDKTSILAHLSKTQAQLQTLNTKIIDFVKIQNPEVLGRELSINFKPSTAITQLNTIQKNLTAEIPLKNAETLQNNKKAVIQLEKSLGQLQATIQLKLPNTNKEINTTLLTSQKNLHTLSNNQQFLMSTPLGPVNQANKVVLQLIETIQKGHGQNDIANTISQQLNTFVKPVSSFLSHTVNTPANQAIMQLLGIAYHGQQLDQNTLQNKVQQQLKSLLEQVSAKLQINQLRHLSLDVTRETSSPIVQQLQGELPLRFNEQVLPLSYSIQGFDENEAESQPEDQENPTDTKEKTRRWQVFLSLDLPDNGTLHCKITLVDHHIQTTLWAESAELCRSTQKSIEELRDRLTQAGLSVDTLQCFEGKPPQDETSVSYNLVDITT